MTSHAAVRALGATGSDLVTANHILVLREVLDAFGHVSARTSPGADTFLLSRNLAPGSVTSSDLLVHHLDGRVESDEKPYAERFIHAEIYRHRPDVMSVVHSHSASVIPFTVTGVALKPVFHMAAFLETTGTPVHEISEDAGESTDLLITSSGLGATLATTLGDRSVALMRGHGYVAVGATIPEAVFRAVYTQVNAKIQLAALGLGSPRWLGSGEAEAADRSVRAQTQRAWNVWRAEVRR